MLSLRKLSGSQLNLNVLDVLDEPEVHEIQPKQFRQMTTSLLDNSVY